MSKQSWRDVLPVHPAADLFPIMSQDELRELGEDIEVNGLQTYIVLVKTAESPVKAGRTRVALLDGRNRLDALEAVGYEIDLSLWKAFKQDDDYVIYVHQSVLSDLDDPYAHILSANIHRRHLTAEQRRELIAKVLKAKPETSNNQIAKQVKADDKTVAKVRKKLEATSDIPKLEKTKGKDGKERLAKRKPAQAKDDDLPTEQEAEESEQETYYDHARRLVECMTDQTRRKFFTSVNRYIEIEAEIGADEDAEDGDVAPPEVIEDNAMHTLERHMAVASAFRKIFKVSSLDREAKARISKAIKRLVTKWQSTEAALTAAE